MVELLGFEPRITEPKSAVLPLHHSSIVARKRCKGKQNKFKIQNSKFKNFQFSRNALILNVLSVRKGGSNLVLFTWITRNTQTDSIRDTMSRRGMRMML